MNITDHKTKEFLEKIDLLISRGVIKNHAEVVNTLNWNKSVMSSVKNGSLHVPQHIYNKFKEVYSDSLTQITNPGLQDQDLNKKYMALLEATVKEKTELLEEVRTSLKQMPKNMMELTDLILNGQELIVQKLDAEISRKIEALTRNISLAGSSVSRKKPLQKDKH